MPITYDETVQVVLDLLQRTLKAEAEVVKLNERIKDYERQLNELRPVDNAPHELPKDYLWPQSPI